MVSEQIFGFVFYRTESSDEAAHDWLKYRSRDEKRNIAAEFKTDRLGWPIGMPVVSNLEPELRGCARDRIGASIAFFTNTNLQTVTQLHLVKKPKKMPAGEHSERAYRRKP